MLAGAVGMLLTPLFLWTVKEPQRTEWTAPCTIAVVVDEVFEKSRVARMLTVAGSLKMVASYSLSAFLPIWYARTGLIGYSNKTYALWNALVITSGGCLSAFAGVSLSNVWSRFDKRAPVWIGLLGSIISIPVLCVMILTSYMMISLVLLFFYHLFSEAWYGPVVALLQASVRPSVNGQAITLFLIASTMVGNLGPALVGLIDPGGQRIGLHLLWICVAANVGAAIAFLATAREIGFDPVSIRMGLVVYEARDRWQVTTGRHMDNFGLRGSPRTQPKAHTLHWGNF